jgi:hypothetical protein
MATLEEIHDKSEINRAIAIFMGGSVFKEEEYELPHGSRGYVMIKHWNLPSGVPLHDYDSAKIGHFRYTESWDWLMPVIRKINTLDKAIQFAIFKTYVSCTVEKSGKFYKDFSFSHAEYITSEQTDLEAAYNLVYKFVVWYNEHYQKSN